MEIESKRKESFGEVTLKDLLNRTTIDVGEKFKPLLKRAKGVSSLIGLDKEILDVLASLAQGQNVFLVGLPGTGKTTLAKELAAAAGVPYSRTDGNEDVEPSQIVGYIDKIAVSQLGLDHPLAIEMGDMLRAHGGVYHIDEINRIPPRAANALLQGLEEGFLWLSGYKIVTSFVAIATINPVTFVGTYELDDALVDRFDAIWLQTPSVELLESILKLRAKINWDNIDMEVDEKIFRVAAKLLDLITNSYKKNEKIESPASVRAGISAINKALAYAYLRDSNKIELEDLKKAVISSFTWRMKPSVEIGDDYQSRKKLLEDYFEQALREVEIKWK